MKKKILTFILTLALWFIFAGRFNIQVFFLGTLICSILSLMLSDYVFGPVKTKFRMYVFCLRLYYIIWVFSAYIYDVFSSAVRVSRHAFETKPSFSARIVRTKTSLENVDSIVNLINFITLTQGSLVIDFDVFNKDYVIHWIDANSDEKVEAKKKLIKNHENLITKIFE